MQAILSVYYIRMCLIGLVLKPRNNDPVLAAGQNGILDGQKLVDKALGGKLRHIYILE